MRTAVRVTSVLVVCVLVCVGCFASKETRDGADKLVDAIGTPSWAESVVVSTGVSGLAEDTLETAVILKEGATAEQIAEFVLTHPDRVADAGLEPGLADLRFVTPHGLSLTVPAANSTDDDGVREALARWEQVLPMLGGVASVELSRETGTSSYSVRQASGGADAVADLFAALRNVEGLTVWSDAWSVSTSVDGTAMWLASPTLPTASEVASWAAMVDALDLLPPRFAADSISMERYDPHAAVDLKILVPDDVTRKNITPKNYGDELWSTLEAQLRAIAGLKGGWSYVVQWAPQDLPDHSTIMLSLLDDKEPIDNEGDPATLWSQQARAYVDGL